MMRLLLLTVVFLLSLSLHADEGSKATRNLDFEGEVIEGVNKQSFDSLSQISEQDEKAEKPHLYMRRPSFSEESKDTLRELLEIK